MHTIYHVLFYTARDCVRVGAFLACLAFVSSQAPCANAQNSEPSKLVGPWAAWLETPAQHLRLLIDIRSVSPPKGDPGVSEIEGTITSPDQTPTPLPFSQCTLNSDGTFEFTVTPNGDTKLSYSFRGKQAGDQIQGVFENAANAKLPLTFRFAKSLPDEGTLRLGAPSAWQGELDMSVRKIGVRFRVYDQPPYAEPDSPRILFDSLSEKVFGFPVRLSSGDKGQVVLSIPSLPGNAKFLVETPGIGERIRGKFTQSFVPLSLELRRVDELQSKPLDNDALIRELKRMTGAVAMNSTVPAPPMPDPTVVPAGDSLANEIREESFSIERIDYRKPKVKQDGRWMQPKFRINGTVTWPAGALPESRVPAVVMVTGSGPQDRDETIGEHKPFQVLAHWLAKHGIASLRYDDRGTGESTGDFLGSTTVDFADDALAVWQHARTVAGIDRLRIGLLGHSEGGIIGPMVAANEPEVAFLILLAPPAFAGTEILAAQIDRISELQGVDAETRKASIALQRKLQELALEPESDKEKTISKVRQAILESWESLRGMSEGLEGESEEARRQRVVDQILTQFQGLQTPWMRYFLAFDPTSAWLVMQAPTLGLWGDKDVQVLAGPNRERLLDVASRNPRLIGDLVVLPGLNHLMQPADTGLPDEYDRIDVTFDPSALRLIKEWLQHQNIIP